MNERGLIMRRKSILFIIIAALLMTIASLSVAFADTAAPGQVVVRSVKAKTASSDSGKASVTVKWKKQNGSGGYQIYLKRIDGEWAYVKTVSGKKTSTRIKACVGKNFIQVRAISKNGDQTLAGPFSETKAFKVKAKMTIQKYMKKHGSRRKVLEKEAVKNDMTLKFRDNDLIYTYDLAKDIDAASLTPERIKRLNDELTKDAGMFSRIAKAFNKACILGSCRVIIKYTHNGNPVLTREFH